jgi:signal transduction histidine kinase
VNAAQGVRRNQEKSSSLPLLRFALLYMVMHLGLDYLSQITAFDNGVSLWYPAVGLILGAVLRLRLIGATLAIVTGMFGFLISKDPQFNFWQGMVFCILGPIGPLFIRTVMRRFGYIDPRAVPRPQMAIALTIASAVYALWDVGLANLLLWIFPGGQPLTLTASFQWWLGDLVGILAIGSFLFQTVFPFMLGEKQITSAGVRKWLPRIIGYGMLSLIPWALHFITVPGQNLQLVFLAAVPIFYAALRRGIGETSLAIVFANLGFMLAAHNSGINNALELQAMALMINIGGLFTAAITTNQNAMLRALHQTLLERDALTSERADFERRLSESQRLDALGRMAGGMAHEINNLLHPIKSFARSAATAPDEKRLHFLARINECADNAHRIVTDALTFARESIDNPISNLKQVDAQNAIEAAINIASGALPETIELKSRIKLGAAQMRCDVGGVSQVVVNIVNNARDAMPDGGTISITGEIVALDRERATNWQLQPGSFVCLNIKDNGYGMDESIARRIFEPFFTTKDVGRGTGLGLSVVYGMVRRWQGNIFVESSLGMGTTFTIMIPLAKGEQLLHVEGESEG